MTLEFTPAAVSDLRYIRQYTLEKWGPKQEQFYLDSLWQKFEDITVDPAKWRRREYLFPGCQIASQGRHLILFRVTEGKLQIVRILHSSMDLPRHLPRSF
jgi:toxin ParE1/3/4